MGGPQDRGREEQCRLWSFIRHARLDAERVDEFWLRIRDLVEEFDRLPRSGDTTYGMAVGIYPVDGYPRLPAPEDGPNARARSEDPA